MVQEESHEPTRRDWRSFWSLVAMQIAQAFNVNAAKFLLVSLGAWLISRGESFKGVEHVIAISLVVPYMLLAPTAGWLSDRFPKSKVILWTSVMHLAVLGLLAGALHLGFFPLAICGFFLLSTQAALLSPAKVGVVKELVGAKRLGFASGVMEGTVILAILAGQIIGGKWFDRWGIATGLDGWQAAWIPVWWLCALSAFGILLAWAVRPTQALSNRPFSFREATSHLRDLGEVWHDRTLRLSALGVAFFWGFGGFINLAVLEIAEDLFHGGPGTGDTFASLWAMAVIGIAVGSVLAGMISRRNIEMGLAPFGGIIMTGSTLALAVACLYSSNSWVVQAMLILAGAGGAIFLVPLQAVVQDRPAEEKRGAVISSSNLLNNFFGIAAVILQLVLKLLHVPMAAQFGIMGVLALGVTAVTFHHLGTDLIRLIGLAMIRTFYRIRTVGDSHIPREGGVLLLPNHITFADAFFLSAACPRRVRFIMDEGFMANPWIRGFAKIFQTVPIARGNAREALRTAADALKQGDVLCLFPEGQITRTGTLSPVQRGFELIGRMAGVPLVPVWTDGAWGSIFSFERGRFFHKRPYQIPYRLTVAFGKPLDAKTTDETVLRDAMLEASAAAIATHGQEELETSRTVATIRRTEDSDEAWHRAWINGYQIGQIHALPRREPFAFLAFDPVPAKVTGLSATFPALFGAHRCSYPGFDPSEAGLWVGGDVLRAAIAGSRHAPVVFFDFSPEAITPLAVDGLVHCPCLAVGGIAVSMSMPDPPLAFRTSEPQLGRKPGSWGKLLPGFFLRNGADGRLRAFGPAAPEEGLPLPEGCTLDAEGFLVTGDAALAGPADA